CALHPLAGGPDYW
nr:immunoglobulin heavy chain junction region [Macaca mulatta]